MLPQFSSRLDGHDIVSASRQCGGIAPGPCPHVQHPARLDGNELQYVTVDFVEGDLLVLDGERIRRLGIPGDAPRQAATLHDGSSMITHARRVLAPPQPAQVCGGGCVRTVPK
ncbi:hypothetical protein [Streptomyces sp. NPDC002403]